LYPSESLSGISPKSQLSRGVVRMVVRSLLFQEGIPRGIQRLRVIWWTYDLRYPPPRYRILMAVGMTKVEFARRVAKIYGIENVGMVYGETYGGAWWRITDPLLISVAHQHYGRVVCFDERTREVVEVF